MGNNNRRFPALCILMLIMMFSFTKSMNAQERGSDSLFAARLMEDNLALYHQTDSLEVIIDKLHTTDLFLSKQIDSLQGVIFMMRMKIVNSKNEKDSLLLEQINLNRVILANKQEMLQLNTQMEQKSQLLRDKDFLFSKMEMELKSLKSEAEINQLKLEGKLDVHDAKMEGKDTEIAYLQKSVEEKDRQIREKTKELATYYSEKDNSLRIIDSLARALTQKEFDYIKVSERLKIIEAQYNDLIAKQTAAANKKKKIRFIQGVGLKTYRTPDWEMAPESASSPGVYVISNKNAGKIDFDYITGVSISILDISKENAKFTYDAGLFVGFGGQNLFKNFYIGPSFKLFDFFHVNFGANIAEYQQLNSRFKEGDPLPVGMSISTITVKEWKTNLYFGFTIDLELLAAIPKKF